MKDNLNDQLRKGSTAVLILAILDKEAMYGYRISRELEKRSQGYFAMAEGLLYPALHQMEESGLIVGEWKTVGNRRRKYYRITTQGREYLKRATAEWKGFTSNLFEIIGGDQP
ncbi:MAG: PadR family transcriptional regulator [Candidatus Brachytrichaceae bacterium NZ_4S206]|jgi:DNA-binding PadR family transcriptional regulator